MMHIATYNGLLDLDAIHPSDVDPRDIAHHLSYAPRWAGAPEHPYSVLQHTIAMHRYACLDGGSSIDQDVLLGVLLHDAHEYLTGDIPAPVKAHLQPAISNLERRIDAAIYERFNFIPTPEAGRAVKYIDIEARAAEAHVLKLRGDHHIPEPRMVAIVRDILTTPPAECRRIYLTLLSAHPSVGIA